MRSHYFDIAVSASFLP